MRSRIEPLKKIGVQLRSGDSSRVRRARPAALLGFGDPDKP